LLIFFGSRRSSEAFYGQKTTDNPLREVPSARQHIGEERIKDNEERSCYC